MNRSQTLPDTAADQFECRRATEQDMPGAYAVYVLSLYDYLHRAALVDEATAKDPPVDADWKHEGDWVEHFWGTAAENWVAVDEADTPIGWALSIERDGVLELTHLFVRPGIQSKGVGRALIERALPPGRGQHRVILATQDARALGLYLRSGVAFQTSSARFELTPQSVVADTDLEFERLAPDDDSIELIAAVERAVIGHRRDTDIRFLLGMRPAWLARRDGLAVGFAFGAQPDDPGVGGTGARSGPMGVLDAADMPALLDHVESQATAAGVGTLNVNVPFTNRIAVDHLLARGAKIDPFFIMVLSDAPSMRLDRWIHTGPFFIV